MLCYPLVNPSSISINRNKEILTGYQRPVTGFTGVSTYYFHISFPPFNVRAGKNSKSIIGIRFYNDSEGAYINRMRFYGMYAFHSRLSDRLNLSGGIDFGAMNFSVKATPTTEGASVFKPDANTGLWLYNDDFHIGISVNQLFNSVFRPLDERTVLPTHLNVSASFRVAENDIMEIKPHILITYPYYSGSSIRVGLYGVFFKKVISAISWNRKTSISAMLGVNEMSIGKSLLNLVLSYTTTVKKATLNINTLEISALVSL